MSTTSKTRKSRAARLSRRVRARARLGWARLAARARDLQLPLPGPPARLVYHPDYIDFPREAGPRHAFDVRRPLRILERLRGLGLLSADQVLEPTPASLADLERIHDPDFLARMRRADVLAQLLHVRTEQLLLYGDPLTPFLLQAGGTLLGARHAVAQGTPVFNLGGGFHHAQRDRAEGFCPINDVAVAIAGLRASGQIRRALVVDLDYHHGNGTALIFSRDEEVFTLSVHGQLWAEVPDKEHHLDLTLPAGTADERYLDAVEDALGWALQRFAPDVAFYLAGADAAANDRLGDFRVSEEGMLRRDLHVWHEITSRRIPLVVLLAGGYGPFAWVFPFNFIFSVLTGAPIEQRHRPSDIGRRLRRVQREISSEELTLSRDEVTEEEVLAELTGAPRRQGRLLGYYTREGIELALRRYGLFEMLRERGFDNFELTIDTSDRSRHTLRIYYERQDPEHLLTELIVALRPLSLPGGETCQMLSIDWLCMQDPRASFTLDRPPLPGQRHPGLGLGRWVVELFRLMAERLSCDGVLNNPDRFHNAKIYASVMRHVDPVQQGQLQALMRDLEALGLLEATLAVDQGRVRHADSGVVFHWAGYPQALAVTERLRAWFARPEYAREVAETEARLHFIVD